LVTAPVDRYHKRMKKVTPPDRLIKPLLQLVTAAAQSILEIYSRNSFDIHTKNDRSPLTAADMASHHILTRGLAELHPGLPILSEENTRETPPAKRHSWNKYWLVDPLDGTKEFIKRNGEFTVNVALIEFGRPVLGIVNVPVDGCSYVGLLGHGAYRYQRDETRRSLRVAGPVTQRPVRVVASRSHTGGELENFARALGPHEFHYIGSSLKFCLVAEAGADVYPRLKPTSEWDTAAGQAVLEAAGGSVTDLSGEPLRYNTRDTLINPSFIASGDLARDYARIARQSSPR